MYWHTQYSLNMPSVQLISHLCIFPDSLHFRRVLRWHRTAINLFGLTLKAQIWMIIYRLVVAWAFLDTYISLFSTTLTWHWQYNASFTSWNRMKRERRMCNAKTFITFIIICALVLVILTFLRWEDEKPRRWKPLANELFSVDLQAAKALWRCDTSADCL